MLRTHTPVDESASQYLRMLGERAQELRSQADAGVGNRAWLLREYQSLHDIARTLTTNGSSPLPPLELD